MIGLIVILCIIVILAIIVITVINFEIDDTGTKNYIIGSIITITFTCVFSICCNVYFVGEPKAIDVYRGKTTLEITYKDNIPIDSVVVFK